MIIEMNNEKMDLSGEMKSVRMETLIVEMAAVQHVNLRLAGTESTIHN